MKKFLLMLPFLFLGSLYAQNCSDLFFSEYVEGSGNNKTLEIYNPTSETVDLGQYVIKRYSNGSPVPTEELPLEGTIGPGDAFVITNGQTDSVWVGSYWSVPIDPVLYALGDFHCSGDYPTPMYFNGDDALTLEKVTGGVVDIFGKTFDDPGPNGWNDIPPYYYAGDDWWTSWSKDQTLIRKPGVTQGVSDNPEIFMVNMEWDSIPKDTWDSLGFHTCDCHASFIGELTANVDVTYYPNPLIGDELNIKASEPIEAIEIISFLGRRVLYQANLHRNEFMIIDIPDLENGIFLVKVLFENNRFVVSKIIVE